MALDDIWFALVRKSVGTPPELGSAFGVRFFGKSYRLKLLAISKEGWLFRAPSPVELFQPLKPGDPVILERDVVAGLLVCRCMVHWLDGAALLISRPRTWKIEDRRRQPRWTQVGHLAAKLDGERAELMDISENGARARTPLKRQSGTRVKLEIDGTSAVHYGWVLGVEPNVLRMRFEDSADLGKLLPDT